MCDFNHDQGLPNTVWSNPPFSFLWLGFPRLCRLAHKLGVWASPCFLSPEHYKCLASKIRHRIAYPDEAQARRMAPPRSGGRDPASATTAVADLFASRELTHCALFFILRKDDPADATAHQYVFSPFGLLPLLLKRVWVVGQPLVLIAPNWPEMVWFSVDPYVSAGELNMGKALPTLKGIVALIEPACVEWCRISENFTLQPGSCDLLDSAERGLSCRDLCSCHLVNFIYI